MQDMANLHVLLYFLHRVMTRIYWDYLGAAKLHPGRDCGMQLGLLALPVANARNTFIFRNRIKNRVVSINLT